MRVLQQMVLHIEKSAAHQIKIIRGQETFDSLTHDIWGIHENELVPKMCRAAVPQDDLELKGYRAVIAWL